MANSSSEKPRDCTDPIGVLDDTVTDAGRAALAPVVRGQDDLCGTHLAHFRLHELLGRGGMGEVYRATDEALDRAVAVKVLARRIADDQRLRKRFFREARAQARIQHPNVCHIYYIGEERGYLFFAMEYIDGESVSELLAREGALQPARAVEICRMAALGLKEAQRHGFSHRDVKPSNLMLDRGGLVKVVDFGLVKHTAGSESSPPAPGPLAAMDKTAIVGTPLYMAPEQARGETVDHRSDVYALGATLHHLVSGKPPFDGDTPTALVSLHSTGKRPRITARKRRGPSPIDVLCDRMMAKQPGDRFDDYDALIAAMENVSPARTRPAGFLVRAFAILIDVVLVRLAWVPLELSGVPLHSNAMWAVASLAYFTLGHGRYGRTLGKAALELEVVTAEGHKPPGYRASALRYLVQWGPIQLVLAAGEALEYTGISGTAELVLVLILLAVMLLYVAEGLLSSWLVPNKRTIWDRIAGTRVRYRRLTNPQPASTDRL